MTDQQNPRILTRALLGDLVAAHAELQAGAACAAAYLEHSLSQADSQAGQHAYLRRFDAQALATARAVDAQFGAGTPLPPLAGLAVSVKDLFDVAGQPTTAGSKAMSDAPPAAADCPSVARLRAAGAALTGHTNLSEFAFSGVGINPHFGTPPNAGTLALDAVPRIPGGSTSGGATTVACGAAFAALGSDTGGSIRIPAALQGLVGFKNTQRLTSTAGAVPLSTTLDTACAITRSVRDAVLLHEVLAARSVRLGERAPGRWRIGVPTTLMLDALDATVARAFERSLAALRSAGMLIDDIDLPALDELAGLNARGTFAAAESWAWHQARLTARRADYDPRVALRIAQGAGITAAEYIELLRARKAWIEQMDHAMRGFDLLLSPTVPIVAPPVAPLLHDDEAFFGVNRQLLRNPSVVNFLDGCALSLPCHRTDELPVGLMLWAGALQDDLVLAAALQIDAALASARGLAP